MGKESKEKSKMYQKEFEALKETDCTTREKYTKPARVSKQM